MLHLLQARADWAKGYEALARKNKCRAIVCSSLGLLLGMATIGAIIAIYLGIVEMFIKDYGLVKYYKDFRSLLEV